MTKAYPSSLFHCYQDPMTHCNFDALRMLRAVSPLKPRWVTPPA